jgi:serine O-acetyltransferase
MVGIPARQTLVDAADYQKQFMPYGTPCSERFDPATQQVEILKCELEAMRKRIDALVADQAANTGERDRA